MNDYSGVITRFIDSAKHESPLTIHGDGSQTRDFINVKDVVDAILKCRESKVAVGEVLNIGTGKPTSVNELAKTVLDLAHSNSPIRFDKPRKGDIKDSYADVSKAEALLGFKSKLSLKDGLRIMLKESLVTP
jgi:UDP-glucose 4-epimerase